MKILLLGKDGQVGWELQRSLAVLGDIVALGRDGDEELCGDLCDAHGIERTVQTVRPDVVVNAAAYTNVDKAEQDESRAHAVNATGPDVLAHATKAIGAILVHYSTDYVFDGSGARPWGETDEPAPINTYGFTKLEGERAIKSAGCDHLIFRTSWVYGVHGQNFAKTILRLAAERSELSVIKDQFGAPTGADLIADVTAHAIALRRAAKVVGTYHLAAAGVASWYDYALYVLKTAAALGFESKAAPEAVIPIPSSAYNSVARRPMNSRLDTSLLCRTFGLRLPAWEHGVTRLLTQILRK